MFVLALALVLVSACSGGSAKTGANALASTTTAPGATTAPGVSQGWTNAGVSAMKTLARRLQKVAPGQCPDVMLLPHDDYLAAAQRLHLDPPLAAVDCQVYGSTAELNVFSSAAARDAHVERRTNALCQSAKRAKTSLAALYWAEGPAYAIQFDSEGAARRAAQNLGGSYTFVACPGQSGVAWDAAAEARVAHLGAQLAARPAIKCGDLQLLDRVRYAHDPRYKDRLPAAYAQCSGPGSSTIYVAAFDSNSVQPGAFIAGETTLLCGHGIAGVQGPDFAIIATNVKVAALAAAATGGRALPPAC